MIKFHTDPNTETKYVFGKDDYIIALYEPKNVFAVIKKHLKICVSLEFYKR